MDITMIGLQNAGKTSLLRVLAVSPFLMRKDRIHRPLFRSGADEVLSREESSLSSKSTFVPSSASRRRHCFIRVPMLLLRATMSAIIAGSMR